MAGGGKRRETRWRLTGEFSREGAGKAGLVFYAVVKSQKKGDDDDQEDQLMKKFPCRVSVCLSLGCLTRHHWPWLQSKDVFLPVPGLEARDQGAPSRF